MLFRSFVFQDSYREKLKTLTDEEKGILVMALSEYHENGIIPELEQPMAVAFMFIKDDIDRIEASYAAKCEANKNNRAKRTKKARAKADDDRALPEYPENDGGSLPTSTNAYEALPTSTNGYETPQDKDKDKEKEKEKSKAKDNKETVSFDTDEKTDGDFARFWSSYPRKQNRAKALKVFRDLDPDEDLLSVILDAVERQKQSPQWTRDGGQFIPLATTWLSGRRWEDEDVCDIAPRQSGRSNGYDRGFGPDECYDYEQFFDPSV